MRQDAGETREVSHLELLRRSSTYGDLDAWAAFQQGLEETVLTWLHEHPGREAASRLQSEQHFVAQAFERLREAVFQRKVTCDTISEVLLYLHASLNGAILETLRVSSRPGVVPEYLIGKRSLEDNAESCEVWDWLLPRLSGEREQRLVYLLYNCGLEPAEIVLYWPQECSDVREVTRLRGSIFAQLMQGSEL